MTDPSIRRQIERERRERRERERFELERLAVEQREQQRLANLKNQWAQVTTARANAVLAGYQHARYCAGVQKLQELERLINGE